MTAKRFAVAQGTIYRWLRDLGLPTPRYTRSKSRHNRPRAAARDREIVVSPEAGKPDCTDKTRPGACPFCDASIR